MPGTVEKVGVSDGTGWRAGAGVAKAGGGAAAAAAGVGGALGRAPSCELVDTASLEMSSSSVSPTASATRRRSMYAVIGSALIDGRTDLTREAWSPSQLQSSAKDTASAKRTDGRGTVAAGATSGDAERDTEGVGWGGSVSISPVVHGVRLGGWRLQHALTG